MGTSQKSVILSVEDCITASNKSLGVPEWQNDLLVLSREKGFIYPILRTSKMKGSMRVLITMMILVAM